MKAMLVQQSMNKKGNCWVYAVGVSFLKTMKTEIVDHAGFQIKFQVELAVFEWTENWCNRQKSLLHWVFDTLSNHKAFA